MFVNVIFFVTGVISLPNYAPYSISKYGVEAFSYALRREMKPWRVGVNIIEPGGFQTSMLEPSTRLKQCVELWESISPTMKQEYGERHFKSRESQFSRKYQLPISCTINNVVVVVIMCRKVFLYLLRIVFCVQLITTAVLIVPKKN